MIVARLQAWIAVIRGNKEFPDSAALHPGSLFYCFTPS
jgi:hypothetical protein